MWTEGFFPADGLADKWNTSSAGMSLEIFFRPMVRPTSEIPAQPICPEKQLMKQDPNPKVNQMNSKIHKIWAIPSQHLGESLPKRSRLHLGFRGFWKGKRKDEELKNNLNTPDVKSNQTWSKSKYLWAVASLTYGESLPKRSLQKDRVITFNFADLFKNTRKWAFGEILKPVVLVYGFGWESP